MDLYAVLSELDGTGVPLGYLFVAVNATDHAPISVVAGAKTNILEQFLQPIKAANLNPTFLGCDKDRTEIGAIQQVWLNVSVQLCYWHAKRAIQMKLRDNRRTKTQSHYYPDEVKVLVPALDICWGSYPIRRPSYHRYGPCQCESSRTEFPELGNIETNTKAEQDMVSRMFSRHYNMHSMIPDLNGTYRSADQNHSDCINEVYFWCCARNYFRLWAYLYCNWYATIQWKLWACSTIKHALPVLKTTMIVESHWRKIKHDYLHRFNHPRIYLVVWDLILQVIPHAIDRMKSILNGNHRKGAAAWRKPFKRQWNNLQKIEVEPRELEIYHTSPSRWTCACSKFLLSRFLICEHIIACYENISDRSKFFSKVCRQRKSPFWTEDQLLLRPEYRVSSIGTSSGNGDEVIENSSEFDSEFSEDNNADYDDEDEENHDLEDGDENTPQLD